MAAAPTRRVEVLAIPSTDQQPVQTDTLDTARLAMREFNRLNPRPDRELTLSEWGARADALLDYIENTCAS